MPVNEALYPFLICPISRIKLHSLNSRQLQLINRQIKNGDIVTVQKQKVEKVLMEGFISEDGKYIYRIDEGLPILLPDEAIICPDNRL